MIKYSGQKTEEKGFNEISKDKINNGNDQNLSFSEIGLECKEASFNLSQINNEAGFGGWNTNNVSNKLDGFALLKKIDPEDSLPTFGKTNTAFQYNYAIKGKILVDVFGNISKKCNQNEQEQTKIKPILNIETDNLIMNQNSPRNHLHTFEKSTSYLKDQISNLSNKIIKKNIDKKTDLQLQKSSTNGFVSPIANNTAKDKYLSSKTVLNHQRKKENKQFLEDCKNKDCLSQFKTNKESKDYLNYIKKKQEGNIQQKSFTTRYPVKTLSTDFSKIHNKVVRGRGIFKGNNFEDRELSNDTLSKTKKINMQAIFELTEKDENSNANDLNRKFEFLKTFRENIHDVNSSQDKMVDILEVSKTDKLTKKDKTSFPRSYLQKNLTEPNEDLDGFQFQTLVYDSKSPKPITFNYGDVNDLKKNHSVDFKNTISAYFYQKERNSMKQSSKKYSVSTNQVAHLQLDKIQCKAKISEKTTKKFKTEIETPRLKTNLILGTNSILHKSTKSECFFTQYDNSRNFKNPIDYSSNTYYEENSLKKDDKKIDLASNWKIVEIQSKWKKFDLNKEIIRNLHFPVIKNNKEAGNTQTASKNGKPNIIKTNREKNSKNLAINELSYVCRSKLETEITPKPLKYLEERIKMNSISKKQLNMT